MQWFNTVRLHSAIGMHSPVQYEQAYTPPDDTDNDGTTAADANDTDHITDARDVGLQITNQPQPATTGARQNTLHNTGA
ncbi:hypothetical protein SAMN04487766_12323 [Actinomyces ruminicola]|uniref:Integrase core domain-containing protein n=1 Tax=Actinomyces ruminicola TaxID=332524 RepID=A0A1H0ACV8_9ACTO|nr:hypothetical protein SAMN04487766_12323 [Actinomyces ruminicola]